jgi:starch-binding outer membrane protein, SusD/RagB family
MKLNEDNSRESILKISVKRLAVYILLLAGISSCESFLETNLPKSKIASEVVFSDDVTATSAVTGIYADMFGYQNFASGDNASIVALGGLSSDELINYPRWDAASIEFEQNTLSPNNDYVLSLWTSMYKSIYQANAALEGLAASSGVTAATKDQLSGEALFIRAFSYFYLVNLYGDIPLITTTDYRKNAEVTRASVTDVYEKIIEDLVKAQELLSDDYVTQERVRPNKAAATALLARVHLYRKEWSKAEIQSTAILDNSSYSLPEDLNEVFLANSNEAIWQLSQPTLNTTNEASYFGLLFTDYNVLNNQIVNTFEIDDKRFSTWVNTFDTGSELLYYPFKYQQIEPEDPPREYSMVLRLAEQYLIRAEARAEQDDLAGAIADIDSIRARAGLLLIQDTNPGIDKPTLLLAIEQERRVELFTEWGHRWFDLKRTDRATDVLSVTKTEWTSDDVLYPIPQSEFDRNPKLGSQNDGY